MPDNPDTWREWSKYVLKELERLNELMEGTRHDVAALRTEVAMLKVKSGLWGAVGAAVPIGIMLAVQILMK